MSASAASPARSDTARLEAGAAESDAAETVVTQAPARQVKSSTFAHVRYILGENPVTLIAAILFAAYAVMALLGPMIAPYDPLASDTMRALQGPGWHHWFGTDQLGRDILSRVMVATRVDLGIALASVAL